MDHLDGRLFVDRLRGIKRDVIVARSKKSQRRQMVSSPPLRIVFFGTPGFAVPTLRSIASRHEVVAVVSQPDRPKGRGQREQPTPTKVAAGQAAFRCCSPGEFAIRSFWLR